MTTNSKTEKVKKAIKKVMSPDFWKRNLQRDMAYTRNTGKSTYKK